jgi:hypothetical protein
MMHLHRNCEGIDAAVFSGDLLFDGDRRELLKGYVERWVRAVEAHELQDIKERAHSIDPECWVSYSGKPKHVKQAMDVRRLAALKQAKEMT